MSGCAYCRNPVVVEPDVLPDGRLMHPACRVFLENVARPRSEPKSGSRMRVAAPARPKKRAG